MAKNRGYTLVELMIVIAIMAILTGTSFITLGIMKDAKRSSALNTINNQISSCLIKTKAISNASKPLCMVMLKRDDSSYAIMMGYINGSNIEDANGNELNPNVDANCEAIIPEEICEIKYVASDSSQTYSSDKLVIQFLKSDGSVRYGAGKYELYTKKSSGQELFATIHLDAISGNHYSK